MENSTDSPAAESAPSLGSASGRDRLINALRQRATLLRFEAREAPARLLSQAESLEMWARLVPTDGTWTDVKQVFLEDHMLYLVARTSHGVPVQDGILAHWTQRHGWTPIHIDFHHQQEIAPHTYPESSIGVFLPNNEVCGQAGPK